MKSVKIIVIGIIISLIVPSIKIIHLVKKPRELETASEVMNRNELAMPIEMEFTSHNVDTVHIAYWSNPYPASNFWADFLIGMILYSTAVHLYKQLIWKIRIKRMK